jgi:hypothetical protein
MGKGVGCGGGYHTGLGVSRNMVQKSILGIFLSIQKRQMRLVIICQLHYVLKDSKNWFHSPWYKISLANQSQRLGEESQNELQKIVIETPISP